MYALEKRERNRWKRYALCTRRWPLDRVAQGLPGEAAWRVVYAPEAQLADPRSKRAA